MSKYVPHFAAFTLKTKSLKFYLTNSFVVHSVILLSTITTGKVLLNFQDKLKSKNMELVQASVRVDMVSMPKYTLKELQQVSAGTEEAKKEETPPTEKPEEKKLEDDTLRKEEEAKAKEAEELALLEAKKIEEAKMKKKSFQDMLKKISEKKVDGTGDVRTEKGMHGKEATALKSLALAGNKLSQGVSIYGTGNTEAMTKFQKYLAVLPDHVKNVGRWSLPTYLINKGFKCKIRIWLKSSGELSRAEIYESSGDSDYDLRALEDTRRAAPYPKLAEEFEKRGMDGDILLGFPL